MTILSMKPKSAATSLELVHDLVREIDGYVMIDGSNGSIIAAQVASVAGRIGAPEPVAGTSWTDLVSVAKTATGEYTLTLKGKYVRLVGLSTVVSCLGNCPFNVQKKSDSVSLSTAVDAQTVVLKTIASNSSTGAPVQPTINCAIHYTLKLKKK